VHCVCCDRLLSDYESVLRHPETKEFLDICQKCLKDIPIDPIVPDRFVDDTVEYDEELECYEPSDED
jgi:hypothetical protein